MSGLRIGGLGSGMDTQMMLEQLMRAERMPLDRMKQQRQVLQWKQEDYRAMNAKMLNFRNKAFDMRLSSNYSARSTTSTNTNVATATAGNSAASGAYTLDVERVATKSRVNSSGELGLTGKATQPLTESLEDTFGLVKVPLLNEEGEQLVDSKGQPRYTYKTDEAGNYLDSTGGKIDFGHLDFEINGELFTFDKAKANEEGFKGVYIDPGKDTLNSMITKINRSDAGVDVFYDAGEDKVFMSTKDTGKQISFGENSSHFLTDIFQLDLDSQNHTAGQTAEVTVNGYTLNPESNNFTFGGVNFAVKEVGSTTVNVQRDTDQIFNNIKDFVDQYNALVLATNEKLSEPRNRDYPPLTDEQKNQLSDREAENWEEVARQGHLRNDRILQNALYDMRRAMGSSVDGKNLSQIGITTGDYREGGILHIDEAKLRQAIEEDPEGIQMLFAGDEDNKGIAQQLTESIDKSMAQIGREAGRNTHTTDQSFIGKSIKRMDDRIFAFEERLIRVEDRYWRQFTAMEKAMDQMYNQGQWLSQQLMMM